MTSKLLRHFWIAILVLLSACGEQAGNVTPTATQAPTSTLAATSTPSSMPVSPTPLATATPTSLPVSSAPDGLRLAYVIDGNLYFQDGSNPTLQLTSSGEDMAPQFSDDGQKIAFFRENYSSIYSINIDGSGEQAVVTANQLVALNLGYTETTAPFDTAFVPGTHLLLFRTIRSREEATFISNSDLLVVNTDTAEIRRVLPPGKVGSFYGSPPVK